MAGRTATRDRPRNGGHSAILVVEDDQDVRDSIAEVLREEGYPVEVAAHGSEALDLLRRQRARLPCLIILDLMMPVMNGWDFRAELLKDPILTSIPVVLLSGDPYVKERAAELQVVAAVGKPMELATLLGLVDEFC